MGTLMDAFSKEDRVEVTFSDFYRLMRESTSAELMKMPWTATCRTAT